MFDIFPVSGAYRNSSVSGGGGVFLLRLSALPIGIYFKGLAWDASTSLLNVQASLLKKDPVTDHVNSVDKYTDDFNKFTDKSLFAEINSILTPFWHKCHESEVRTKPTITAVKRRLF